MSRSLKIRVRSRVWMEIMDKVVDHLGGEEFPVFKNQIVKQVWEQVKGEVNNQVDAGVCNQVANWVWNQV